MSVHVCASACVKASNRNKADDLASLRGSVKYVMMCSKQVTGGGEPSKHENGIKVARS